MTRLPLRINDKITCAALLGISLIPVVLAVTTTVRHWVPLPYWDEWHTPGVLLFSYAKGTLSFADFFLQHNESRKVFPRLFYFAFAKLHGWDVRDGMVLSLCEVAVLCGLLLWLFLRTTGATLVSVLVAFALTTFLAFSPVQYDNFLWGLQFEPFFPGVAVALVAVVNLSRLGFGCKTVVNLIIALVATYTYANGMLLWMVGLPLPAAQEASSNRTRVKWYLLFAFVGIVSVGGYFVNYKRPVAHPPFHFGLLQIVHYVILWSGNYFQSTHVSPFIVGSVILTLWIASVVHALFLIRRGAKWRHFYPWLLLGAYALISGVVTAVGRVGFGVDQALSSRYATFSLFIYLALAGMIFALHAYYNATGVVRVRRWLLTAVAVAFALISPAWILCFRAGNDLAVRTEQRNARLLCALALMDVFPTNPDLKLIFPYLDVLSSRAHVLAHAKLLRTHLVSPHFLEQLKKTTFGIDASNGRVEAVAVRQKSLVVSGWVWRPQAGPKPDCVLVATRNPGGQLSLVSVVVLGPRRRDVEKHYQAKKMKALAFWSSTPLSQPPKGPIEVWAIDPTSELALPLASAVGASRP